MNTNLFILTLLFASIGFATGTEPLTTTNIWKKDLSARISLVLQRRDVDKNMVEEPPRRTSRTQPGSNDDKDAMREFLLLANVTSNNSTSTVPIWAYRLPLAQQFGYRGRMIYFDAASMEDKIVILFNNYSLICEVCAISSIKTEEYGPILPKNGQRYLVFRELTTPEDIVLAAKILSVKDGIEIEFEVFMKGWFRARIRDGKVTVEPKPSAK